MDWLWQVSAGGVIKGGKGHDLPARHDRIEKEAPKARPEVQRTTNNTLAAIGTDHADARRRAIPNGVYRGWPVSRGRTVPDAPGLVDAIGNQQESQGA